MIPAETLTVVSCAIAPEAVEPLFELLDADLFTPTSWYDVETQVSRLDVFLEDPAQADAVEAVLLRTAELAGLPPLRPERSTLARSDWAESWKRFFHVEKISPHIVVRPSWETYTAASDERVITLDPGLSFGTGKHATTQACLRFLDQLAEENTARSVRDMGCGSGILAIGAKLLGFQEVCGFDNDPDCIPVSNENAAINHVSIPFTVDDLSHGYPQTDIVVANILAPILIQFAPQVAGSLNRASSARLILSGILDDQYAAVKAAYEAQGLQEVSSLLIENWRSGLFKPGS